MKANMTGEECRNTCMNEGLMQLKYCPKQRCGWHSTQKSIAKLTKLMGKRG